MALGEAFLLQVYQAVHSGPGWNQTLLIITYDEHGGCYDHVPPPAGATPPDRTVGEAGFDFTRFGVRVPAPIDHTSVLKTIEQRWGLPALARRL